MANVERRAVNLNGAGDDFDGALDAGAKTTRLSEDDLHKHDEIKVTKVRAPLSQTVGRLRGQHKEFCGLQQCRNVGCHVLRAQTSDVKTALSYGWVVLDKRRHFGFKRLSVAL